MKCGREVLNKHGVVPYGMTRFLLNILARYVHISWIKKDG
jgi:hypothetical protein